MHALLPPPRPIERPAVIAVMTFVACFALWQIAGSFLVDASPVETRFPELRDIVQRADTGSAPDVVLFGTSRLKGLPAERLDRALAGTGLNGVLNASVPAGDPFTYDRILTALGGRQRLPRLAVVEVNPEMLTPQYRYVRASVARFFTWADTIRWRAALIPSRSVNEAIGSRFAPFYKHRHALWAWIVPTAAPPSWAPAAELDALAAAPEIPAAVEAEIARRVLNTAAGYEDWMRDYEVSGPMPDTLRRFLERCRVENIAAIVLAAPATTTVRKIYTPEREDRFQTFIRGVIDPLGLPFLDFRARLDDRLFVDGVHLSAAGGVRFAELLAADIGGLRGPLRLVQ